MRYTFRWIQWNIEHIAEHGISPVEAEFVVENPDRGYPREIRDGEFHVLGQTWDGSYLQVIYIFSPATVVFVIHARPLTDREKRRLKKHRRKRS